MGFLWEGRDEPGERCESWDVDCDGLFVRALVAQLTPTHCRGLVAGVAWDGRAEAAGSPGLLQRWRRCGCDGRRSHVGYLTNIRADGYLGVPGRRAPRRAPFSCFLPWRRVSSHLIAVLHDVTDGLNCDRICQVQRPDIAWRAVAQPKKLHKLFFFM